MAREDGVFLLDNLSHFSTSVVRGKMLWLTASPGPSEMMAEWFLKVKWGSWKKKEKAVGGEEKHKITNAKLWISVVTIGHVEIQDKENVWGNITRKATEEAKLCKWSTANHLSSILQNETFLPTFPHFTEKHLQTSHSRYLILLKWIKEGVDGRREMETSQLTTMLFPFCR